MYSRFAALSLAGLALSVTSVLAQDTCESYGVDFQNGGSYFINTNSDVDFTCVTQFSGCANDTAGIILVDPAGDSWECTDVQQNPDYTSFLSTCPLEKDQMTSGEWEIIVIGNNGPSPNDPIAFVRSFSITAGPQSTVTAYPTVTYNVTTTPTAFATNTSTVFTTQTIQPTTTVVVPAKTVYYTSTPSAVTTTSFTTVTRTFKTWTHTRTIITQTITPSCTIPPRQSYPDPPLQQWPKNIPFPPGLHLSKSKRDSPADVKAVRARFEAIKARNVANGAKKPMVKRDADAPVVTTTVTSPVYNTTITLTAAVSTVYNLTITTDTVQTTLPATTIHSGTERDTITAPTPTKTVAKVNYTSITITKTNTATLTYKTTVTPSALATWCKHEGGHFGNGWSQWSN